MALFHRFTPNLWIPGGDYVDDGAAVVDDTPTGEKTPEKPRKTRGKPLRGHPGRA